MSSVTTAKPKAGATQRPTTPSPQLKTGQGSKEVRKIAENLGIKTADKTEAELLKEISLKTKKGENHKL